MACNKGLGGCFWRLCVFVGNVPDIMVNMSIYSFVIFYCISTLYNFKRVPIYSRVYKTRTNYNISSISKNPPYGMSSA